MLSLLVTNAWHRQHFNGFVLSIHLFRQQEQVMILQLRVPNPVNMVLNVDQQVEISINVNLNYKHNSEREITNRELSEHTYLGEIVFSFHAVPSRSRHESVGR